MYAVTLLENVIQTYAVVGDEWRHTSISECAGHYGQVVEFYSGDSRIRISLQSLVGLTIKQGYPVLNGQGSCGFLNAHSNYPSIFLLPPEVA